MKGKANSFIPKNKINQKKKKRISKLHSKQDEKLWEKDISSSDIKNDQEFTFSIGIFVEASPEYYGIMELFNEAAVNGNRWKIRVISKEFIKNVVQNSIRSNKYKPFKQLCMQIIRHAGYDLQGKIPTHLLVYFIMYELRRLKHMDNCIKSHTLEVNKAKFNRLQQAIQYELSKLKTEDTSRPSTTNPTNAKDVNSLQINKKVKATSSIKDTYGIRRPDSELSTRLEERSFRFIEDFPLGGPHIYIAITTIYDPELPTELIEVFGLPVDCVVKVGTAPKTEKIQNRMREDNKRYQKILQDITDEFYRKKNSKRKQFNKEKLILKKEKEINKFWSGFINKIQLPEKTSYYALTILAAYIPSLRKINFEKENWKDLLKKLLFDEISYALYNQSDLKQLYKKYISSMEVTNLHSLWKCDLKDMNVYNEILQYIPNESVNIPIIFDIIIAQVSKLFGEETGYDEILAMHYEYRKETSQRQNNLLKSLNELNLTHDLLTVRNNVNDLKPRTILYGDCTRLKSYHLGGSAKFITEKTFRLLSLRYKNLFKSVKKEDYLKNIQRRQHMHCFRNAIGIRDKKKLSEVLIILAVIDRNPFGPKYYCSSHEPSSDLNSTNDTTGQYLIEEMLNNINKNNVNQEHILIQNLNTIEELNPEVLVQTLYDMYISHNTCETIYIPLLDGFLYKFYNCPKNFYKTCGMQTCISLRDFIKYSLPEENKWVNLTLEEIRNNDIPEKIQLNHQLLDDKVKAGLINPPGKLSTKLNEEYNSFSVSNNTFLVHKEESHNSDHQNRRKKIVEKTTQDKCESKEIKDKKAVSTIYNIGPGQRLQFYSRTIEAMFRHGTKIKINFQHQLYEKKMLNLELLTCGHRIYYSSNLNLNNYPTKLLIIHRTGMIFSFQQKDSRIFGAKFTKFKFKKEKPKTSYEGIGNNIEKNTSNYKEKDFEKYTENGLNENNSSTIDESEEMERGQIKSSPHPFINRLSTYSFSASWPSGCLIECNTLSNKKTRYIKQRYLTKGPSCKLIENETYRLILQNNTVIKFIDNNTFEIMFPTGKKISCLNYIWKNVRKQRKDYKTGDVYEKRIKKILPIYYKIFYPDGRIVSIKNEKKVLEENIKIRYHTNVLYDYKVSEMSNGTKIVQKNDSSQIVEFIDGTRFTTVVHVSPHEVFCDWNFEEGLKWFRDLSIISDISGFDEPTEEKNNTRQTTTLENEGYTNINISIFVEHPNFATIYNCSETKSIIIQFPKSTSVYLYSNGTYDIKFAKGTNISIKQDRFVIDKFLDNSLFQHTVIMPHALKFSMNPDPPLIQFLTSDIYGNELKIDTTNFIHYRYALSEENKFCLKHLTDNVNYFFLRRDLSGIEVFPQCRLTNIKKIATEIEGCNIQEFWNTPFKDVIFLYPTITISEEWLMPYSTSITSQLQNKPSTYGKSWIFPFNIKYRSYIIIPKILTIRIIKTLICDDVHKKIHELIREYKNMIDNNLYNNKCKCHKSRPWEDISYKNKQELASLLYENGNVIIKTPDENFLNYVKEYIVLHAARVAKHERKKYKIIQKYNNHRSAILKKEIPPYFGSCFGIAYLLTKEIKEEANKAIKEKEYATILDVLLNKNIKAVTNNDIDDMTNLLEVLRPELSRDGVLVKNVLSIGKELQNSFNNMREVLKYHIGVSKQEKVPDQHMLF